MNISSSSVAMQPWLCLIIIFSLLIYNLTHAILVVEVFTHCTFQFFFSFTGMCVLRACCFSSSIIVSTGSLLEMVRASYLSFLFFVLSRRCYLNPRPWTTIEIAGTQFCHIQSQQPFWQVLNGLSVCPFICYVIYYCKSGLTRS